MLRMVAKWKKSGNFALHYQQHTTQTDPVKHAHVRFLFVRRAIMHRPELCSAVVKLQKNKVRTD